MLSPTRFAFSSNTFRLVFFHYKLTATQNLPLNYSRACRHKKNIVLLSRLGVVFECCTFLQLIENYISLFKGSVNKWLGKKTLRNKPGIPISNNFYFKYAISTYVHLQQNFWCSQPISSFKRKRNKDQKAGHYQNLRIWQWAKMKICRYSFTNLNESSQNWDADQYKVTEVPPPFFFSLQKTHLWQPYSFPKTWLVYYWHATVPQHTFGEISQPLSILLLFHLFTEVLIWKTIFCNTCSQKLHTQTLNTVSGVLKIIPNGLLNRIQLNIKKKCSYTEICWLWNSLFLPNTEKG